MCGPCFAGTHLAFNVMIHAGEAAAYPFSTQSFPSAAYRLVYRRRTVADLELQSKSGHNSTSTLFLMSVLDLRGILSTLHGCACSLWRGLLELQREHTLSVDITPALLSCHFSPCSWVSVLAVSQVCGGRRMNKSSVFFPLLEMRKEETIKREQGHVLVWHSEWLLLVYKYKEIHQFQILCPFKLANRQSIAFHNGQRTVFLYMYLFFIKSNKCLSGFCCVWACLLR